MCRNFSGLAIAKHANLLSNYETKTSNYFTSSITLNNESLLKNENLYETALLDMKDGKLHFHNIDEYMSTIARNARNFNSAKIGALTTVELSRVVSPQTTINSGNSIVYLIGDSSANRQISSNNIDVHGEVFEINAQKYGSNLDSGLVAAIEDSIRSKNKDKKFVKVLQNSLLSGLNAIKTRVTDYVQTFDLNLAPIARNVARLNHSTSHITKYSYVHELASYLTKKHDKVTIKISHAEHLFQSESAADVQQLIHSLATHPNYANKINFIISSPDTNLLLRLSALDSGLSSGATLSKRVVHTSELSPVEVVSVLKEKIAVGPRLSVALSNIYGGHLGDVLRAVEQLDARRAAFSAEESVPLSVYDALYEVLFESGLEGADLEDVEGALRQLVTTGMF
jgi:hypothetical protein